jgi:hypothetical protein
LFKRSNHSNLGDTQAEVGRGAPQMQHRLFACCIWHSRDPLLREYALPLKKGADTLLLHYPPEKFVMGKEKLINHQGFVP